jgi:hypothetical protein
MQAIEYGRKAHLRPGLILLYDPTRDQEHVHHVREELSHFPEHMRPVLLLCNILNGNVESAGSRADLQAILTPDPPSVRYLATSTTASRGTSPFKQPASISNRICCSWIAVLLLLGTCCLCLVPFLPPNSPEPAQIEPAATSVEQRRSAAESLPSRSSTRESHRRPDSGRTREPAPVDARQNRESQADAGGVAGGLEERVPKSPFRVWKDNSGQYSVQAEFVEFQNDRVQLRRLDGSVVSVDPERLSTDDQRYLETEFGLHFGVPVIGQVTVVSVKQPGICEIRFPMDVRVRGGDSVEVHRDGTLIGIFRVLAVHHRDVVVQNATLRPRVGDTAIFRSRSDFPAP